MSEVLEMSLKPANTWQESSFFNKPRSSLDAVKNAKRQSDSTERASKRKAKAPFRLLDLPPELQNMIAKEILTPGDIIHLRQNRKIYIIYANEKYERLYPRIYRFLFRTSPARTPHLILAILKHYSLRPDIRYLGPDRAGPRPHPKLGLNYLATSRNIYATDHQILYTQNRFHIPPGTPRVALVYFDHILQPKHKALIKRIVVPLSIHDFTQNDFMNVEHNVRSQRDHLGRADIEDAVPILQAMTWRAHAMLILELTWKSRVLHWHRETIEKDGWEGLEEVVFSLPSAEEPSGWKEFKTRRARLWTVSPDRFELICSEGHGDHEHITLINELYRKMQNEALDTLRRQLVDCGTVEMYPPWSPWKGAPQLDIGELKWWIRDGHPTKLQSGRGRPCSQWCWVNGGVSRGTLDRKLSCDPVVLRRWPRKWYAGWVDILGDFVGWWRTLMDWRSCLVIVGVGIVFWWLPTRQGRWFDMRREKSDLATMELLFGVLSWMLLRDGKAWANSVFWSLWIFHVLVYFDLA